MVWPRLVMVVVMVVMVMTTGRGQDTDTLPHRQRLRDDLLSGYDKETIPGSRMKAVAVNMTSFTLRNLEMLEETHRLHIHAWVAFSWEDKRLSWDPSDYGVIKKLSFSPRDLWLPDLTVYNAASAEDLPIVQRNRLIVTPGGSIINVTPLDFSISCVVNLSYWPHDVHECILKMGSWVHDGFTIDLKVNEAIELAMEVTENSDGTMNTMAWSVVDFEVVRQEKFYECCEEPYISLDVVLRISRKGPTYNWIIKTPAICLILLTMVVFVLPPGAGEKITFGGLCLLLNLVFLVFTRDTVRYSPSHTPILVQLVVVQFVVTATSVLTAAWVVRAARGPCSSPPPLGLHSLFLSIAPALGLSTYVKQVPGPERARTSMLEMSSESEGESGEKGEHSRTAAQWVLFSAVLDRVVLGLYLIVALIMVITFFMI